MYVYYILFFLALSCNPNITQVYQEMRRKKMLVINGLTVNVTVEVNIPPGEGDKFDIDAVKAEIMRQIENGFLQQLAKLPQSPLPAEVQVKRFIQSNQHIKPDQHISIKSSEPPGPPYQPTTDLTKTLKWGEADVQALQIDYDLHEYQCIDEVYIPGTGSSYRSNRVIVNGNEIKMADYLFVLFLRLVVELNKGNGGWVNIHSLAEERIISDVNKYQVYSVTPQ